MWPHLYGLNTGGFTLLLAALWAQCLRGIMVDYWCFQRWGGPVLATEGFEGRPTEAEPGSGLTVRPPRQVQVPDCGGSALLVLWAQNLRDIQGDGLSSSAEVGLRVVHMAGDRQHHRAHFLVDSFCGGIHSGCTPSRSTPVPSTSYHSSETNLGASTAITGEQTSSPTGLWQV